MRCVPGWQIWDASTSVQLMLRKVKGAKGTAAEGKLFELTCRLGGEELRGGGAWWHGQDVAVCAVAVTHAVSVVSTLLDSMDTLLLLYSGYVHIASCRPLMLANPALYCDGQDAPACLTTRPLIPP